MKLFTFLCLFTGFFSNSLYGQTPQTNPSPAPVPMATPAPPPNQPQAPPQTNEDLGIYKDKKIKYSASAFYSLGNNINTNNLSVVTGGNLYSGNLTFNTANAFGLSLEATNSSENNWGWLGGISYEFARNFTSASGTVSGSAGSVSVSAIYTSSPSTAFLIFYGGSIYRWTDLYSIFCINFNIPYFQPGAGAAATYNFSGSIGAYVGVGRSFSENVSFEVDLQYLTFTGTGTSGTLGVNYNTLTFLDPLIRVKYTF